MPDLTPEVVEELKRLVSRTTPIPLSSTKSMLPMDLKLYNLFRNAAPALIRAAEENENWQETARQYCRNMEFYRGIVHQIGEQFGDAAKTSDDGSIQDAVLALKVPELVAQLRAKAERVVEAFRKDQPQHVPGNAVMPCEICDALADYSAKETE